MKQWLQNQINAQTQGSVIALRLGNFILVKFGVISAVALFMGLVLTTFSALVVFQLPAHIVNNLLFSTPIYLILFSIAYHYILNASDFLKNPEKMKGVGFHFFGGVMGVLFNFYLISRESGVPYLALCDSIVLFVSLCHGVSRLACLNYGCCHGSPIPEARKWIWPYTSYASEESKAIRVSRFKNVKLYPTQCYEMVGNFLIQLILLLSIGVTSSYYPLGLITGLYMSLYGALRFLCEYHRGELDNKYLWGLSSNQWTALALAFTGVTILSTQLNSQIRQIALVQNWDTWMNVFDFWPYFLAMPLLMLLAYGVHYQKVGNWAPISRHTPA